MTLAEIIQAIEDAWQRDRARQQAIAETIKAEVSK